MLVIDAMKRDVAAVSPGDTLHEAARLMRKLGIGFLPVIDENRKPIGALTDRDIVVRACAEDLLPSNVTVGSVMTREVITCRPLDELKSAEELMATWQKSRLMVVGSTGELIGVLSLSDVAEEDEPAAVGETMKEVVAREFH